jgi:hypothetical protein
MNDPINPPHYEQYPVAVIDLAERFNFRIGNVIKYVLRAPYKGSELTDLKKALWYLEREIAAQEAAQELSEGTEQ